MTGARNGQERVESRVSWRWTKGFGFWIWVRGPTNWQLANCERTHVSCQDAGQPGFPIPRLDFGQRSSAEPVTIPTLHANL